MTSALSEMLSERDIYRTHPRHESIDETITIQPQKYKFSVPERNISFEIMCKESDLGWLGNVSKRFSKFLTYDDSWNGSRSKKIDAMSVKYALDILLDLMSPDFPIPLTFPTNSGGIQMEWHQNDIDIEIKIKSYGRADLYYCDGSREWSGRLNTNLYRLFQLLNRLH